MMNRNASYARRLATLAIELEFMSTSVRNAGQREAANELLLMSAAAAKVRKMLATVTKAA